MVNFHNLMIVLQFKNNIEWNWAFIKTIRKTQAIHKDNNYQIVFGCLNLNFNTTIVCFEDYIKDIHLWKDWSDLWIHL